MKIITAHFTISIVFLATAVTASIVIARALVNEMNKAHIRNCINQFTKDIDQITANANAVHTLADWPDATVDTVH